MRKEMGNQNTSGILAEEKNANGAAEKVQEICSSDDLKEDNKVLIQENETKDVQEKAQESNSQEAETDKSCPVEELMSGVKETANGSVNEDHETRTTSLDDVTSNLNESDLEKGMSKFDNEVHDQPCTLNEEKPISELNFGAKSISISSLPQEVADITSEPQEDHNQISESNFEAKSTLISSLHQEAADVTSEPQEDQDDKLVKENAEKLREDPQDEQNNLSDTLDDLQTTSLQDLSVAEHEKQDEFSPLDEQKLMTNELVNEDIKSSDLEKVLLDNEAKENDEIDQIGLRKSLESNTSEELKDTNEVGLVQSISMAQDQQEKKPTDESSESETSIVEVCATQSQSLLETEKVNEFELAEAETKRNESKGKLGVESNPSYKGHQVELKKSPSFDFGIPFDPKSQESDQTPLLYQDRPPMRSFSSCSGLRFQNRSGQTEYLGKSLQYETVEVEEKTIRMERSHSESLRTVAKEKEENLDEDSDLISPKGNGKRKPKSSLFTTCICCTAAIS